MKTEIHFSNCCYNSWIFRKKSALTLTTLHTKTNSKWILALNVRYKTMQDFQEKNVQFGYTQRFLWILNAQAMKET